MNGVHKSLVSSATHRSERLSRRAVQIHLGGPKILFVVDVSMFIVLVARGNEGVSRLNAGHCVKRLDLRNVPR